MSNKILLLSVRPKYAVKLFNETKKVELRRLKPNVSTGDFVLVYVSSPVKAVSGIFYVERIIQDTPSKLWDKVETQAGISKVEFQEYYQNCNLGYGIFLKKSEYFEPPISLELIKKEWKKFHPPQSYKYLSYPELEWLRKKALKVDE
jgi:predicted transcriptional regulator